MRFACEFEEEAAMLALQNIAKRNSSARSHQPFEFCDDAATTFTMNFCGEYESEIEDDRRSRYYSSLTSSMAPQQQAAFEKLLSEEKAYIEAHASEVDQGGTIRGVRTIGSQNILKNLFHTEVVHFEHKKWPSLSDKQMAAADVLLNREYEKTLEYLRRHTKDEIDEGAVTADNVSSVEQTWRAYRDAWVEFARLRYPAAVKAIHAEITLDRCRLLKTIR
jgi:uncharacterized protein YecT (DUF1311 family)